MWEIYFTRPAHRSAVYQVLIDIHSPAMLPSAGEMSLMEAMLTSNVTSVSAKPSDSTVTAMGNVPYQ